MNLRFLTALNVAHSDSGLLDRIGFLAAEIERSRERPRRYYWSDIDAERR